jgi:hypothetical protein
MKTKIILVIIGMTLLLCGNLFSQVTIQRVYLDGNNISTLFQNTGIFNQNTTSGNTAGFIWPKGTTKAAIFTTGLCIGAYVRGQLAQSMASYEGEFAPGYVLNGVPITNSNFKIYSIRAGDNSASNPDYANWYLMIPYGAPYIDVNNNHQYDPGIDEIGIKNASHVIFQCMTDGFASSHTSGEGFGGGVTDPLLNSQIAWTAWCYAREDLQDIQFVKWEIINKNANSWNSAYFSLVCDPDLGDMNDDFIGCDTAKKLGYCYNARNTDATYGTNPPAVGMIFHKSPKDFTSFTFFTNNSVSPIPCESDPNKEPNGAYLMMKGFKKDSSNFMNPLTNPPVPTKFVYTGDPETNTGWTESRGSIQNCGGDTGTTIAKNPYGDRRFIMSSGAENYTVNPNDTVKIYASQLIARGNSNLNSVTALKNYANTAWSVYNSGFVVGILNISNNIPSDFILYQNYPNPFNPNTNIRYDLPKSGFVKLAVYDMLGRELEMLVNEKQSAGTYEAIFNASKYPSGVYFYRLKTEQFTATRKMLLTK